MMPRVSLPVTSSPGLLSKLPGIRAIVSGLVKVGRLGKMLAIGLGPGAMTTANVERPTGTSLFPSASVSFPIAHLTCSLLVIGDLVSATTEMVVPAGIAWANSAALSDAAAALSFRKERRVGFLDMAI